MNNSADLLFSVAASKRDASLAADFQAVLDAAGEGVPPDERSSQESRALLIHKQIYRSTLHGLDYGTFVIRSGSSGYRHLTPPFDSIIVRVDPQSSAAEWRLLMQPVEAEAALPRGELRPSRPVSHRSRLTSTVWTALLALALIWGVVTGASLFGGVGVQPITAIFGILATGVLAATLFRLGSPSFEE